MKTLVMSLILLVGSISAHATQCVTPSYGDPNPVIGDAVANFMENKLGVASNDLMAINYDIEGYLTTSDKIFAYGVFYPLSMLFGESDYEREVELGCMAAQNARAIVELLYLNENGEECELELEVTIDEKIIRGGYTTTVKKNMHPVCE